MRNNRVLNDVDLDSVLNDSVEIGHRTMVIGTNLMGKKTFWKALAIHSFSYKYTVKDKIN